MGYGEKNGFICILLALVRGFREELTGKEVWAPSTSFLLYTQIVMPTRRPCKSLKAKSLFVSSLRGSRQMITVSDLLARFT